MLWKFVFITLLAVGVIGRTVFNPYDPYDAYTEKFMELYCNGNISTEKVPEVKSSIETFSQCVSGLFDRDTLTREIAEATNKQDYTEVLKKYCAKTTELKACMHEFYTVFSICQPVDIVHQEEDATNKLLDFACENHGAKLALFLKEDGPQCIEEKKFEIISCIESTDAYAKSKNGSPVVFEKDCKNREEVMSCLMQPLKSCRNPIARNFAEELQKVVLKSYQCPKVQEIQTGVVHGPKINQDDLFQHSEFSKQLELLKKRKLELEVRSAQIETWNRENELKIQHTIFTSDINTIQPLSIAHPGVN